MRLQFTDHALQRMFERHIDLASVRKVIDRGEVIESYPEDVPFPSRLLLGWLGEMPVHVVAADNQGERITIIITVYEPDSRRWEPLGTSRGGCSMRCLLCKNGETETGTSTVTLERGGTTVVFKKVPAQICNNCGERYYDEEVTSHLLEIAEEAVQAGVQVDVREYQAA